MPFGLKIDGATYQRLVTKMFRQLQGKTMEVYIDDMMVKYKERLDHAKHLQETFELLRAYRMKLNPSKCAFGDSVGRFLDFMVTQRDIEANPAQLKAILESPAPASRKEVQQLTSGLAALRRFISRFTDRLKLFFATLKGANGAWWNEVCDEALTAIKQYLVEPPLLASLEAGETLFVYLAVSDVSMSAALFKEDENKKQRPVFFFSKSLADVETRYSHLEQAAIALRVATKKLRPYFQAHPIVVLNDLPLRSTIHKPDFSERMARWAIELSEFVIKYKPRLAKKGQVLEDFLVEIPQLGVSQGSMTWWILNVDGASCQTGAGIGLQLKSPVGEIIEQAIHLGFGASNNESEYEAILAEIELVATVSADMLLIRSDSQLVVGQVNEEYESRDPRMAKYVSLIKQCLDGFSSWKLEHITRDCKEKADALVAVAASFPIT